MYSVGDVEERKTRPLLRRGTHSRLLRRRDAVKSYYFSIARMSLPRAPGEALLQYLPLCKWRRHRRYKNARAIRMYIYRYNIIHINVSVSFRSRRKKSQRNYHQRRRAYKATNRLSEHNMNYSRT